ncbi:MAG: ATP-binding protein [Mycoplasmataceae bacterium]|nr:ATP-binding protein [Mycoplasmataceae bacterium]
MNKILAALDEENTPKGYKVTIIVNEDMLEWKYTPKSENTIILEKIKKVSSFYKYKLPLDWNNFYLVNLNNIRWTEDKRTLAIECKKIISLIESGKKAKGFWLYGISNSGKTYASIALLNMIALKGKSVAFVNISDLVAKTQDSFRNFNAYSGNALEQVKKADVVIIDDLGSERPTPWFKENILLPIIDYRVKADKTTIFTSNSNISKYGNKLKFRSQNPEIEEDTNNKIISRINSLITKECKIG